MVSKLPMIFSSCARPGFIAFLSFGLLLATFIMEHVFHISVCQMCRFERYPYWGGTILATLMYLFVLGPASVKILKHLLVLNFVTGLGLSLYHVGLEYNLFNLPSFCQPPQISAHSVEALKAQLLNQPLMVPCNIVSLRIFFLSLAEWNAIVSAFLTGLSWILLKKK